MLILQPSPLYVIVFPCIMLFNSVSFAIFLPLVFGLYWFVANKNLRLQNGLLLLASYVFYAFWDWRFLFLLLFSTLLDFITAQKMDGSQTDDGRKRWFWLSMIVNLGFLGVFKYYNFFASSFAGLLASFNVQINPWTLKVILPVGISFYTFHGLSYIIDIYRRRIKPEKDFIDYAVFVSFFPLLVAGPIERATHLLPQIKTKRTFNYEKGVDGLRQILWGLFKKMVIADGCAETANKIFDGAAHYSGSSHLVGAFLFAIQIYGDFSGYSDIALGVARLFGIELFRNFAFPYFSRDIAEFWRRWHISLSTWFRDYLYVPLGGSRVGVWQKVRNTFIIFLVSGFWHGANWTFIFWGMLNALFIMPSILLKTNRNNLDIVAQGKLFPSVKETFSMVTTFGLTLFAWIFFRCTTLTDAFHFVGKIGSRSLFTMPLPEENRLGLFCFIAFFLVVEWLGREHQYALAGINTRWKKCFRWGFYYAIVLFIAFHKGTEQQFIYFQF